MWNRALNNVISSYRCTKHWREIILCSNNSYELISFLMRVHVVRFLFLFFLEFGKDVEFLEFNLVLLKTSSKPKIQLAWRKFEKEVIALAKYYKISPDPIETEVLEDEWHNFKFEVIRNYCYADDNWWTVLTIAAEQELDWPTLFAIAKARLCFNAENATVEWGFSPLARRNTPPRNRRLPFTCDNWCYCAWMQNRTKLTITVWHTTIRGQVSKLM